MSISCPHCMAAMIDGANFCTSCGKALAPAAPTGPRILKKGEFASSQAGQEVQLVTLRKQARGAVTTLGVIGGLQLVLAVLFLALAFSAPPSAEPEAPEVLLGAGIVLLALGAVFTSLAFWARRSPLPAAITGLVLYVSFVGFDTLSAFADGQPEHAFKGILIKVIIVAALSKAVSGGLKHRELRRRLAAGT